MELKAGRVMFLPLRGFSESGGRLGAGREVLGSRLAGEALCGPLLLCLGWGRVLRNADFEI